MNDPYTVKAAEALGENRHADCEDLLRKRLDRHPNDVAALCLLADVMERQDRIAEAATVLTRCLELSPGYTRARHNYAVVLLRQNKAKEALEESNTTLQDDPRNPAFRKLRAAILVRLREYEESIRLCEGLLDEDPHQPEIWTSMGHMLKSVGRREDCINAYRKALALAPHLGEAYWSLANLKIFRVDDDALESMQAQLENPRLGDTDRLHMHFAIGKALEDRKEFESSFRHYQQGNQLRLKYGHYDASALSDHVRRCKTLFTADFFTAHQGQGAAEVDPIFIVGLPRSGSTLVEQILASHSQIEGTMELPDIAAIAKSLDNWHAEPGAVAYPEILQGLASDTFRQLGQAYLEQTRAQRKLGRPYFIDKMPNNFAHAGLIHLILPKARIVDVRRHPLACGFSLFKEHFARAQNFSYSLDTIGSYYRNYVELMEHFDTVLPGRVHRVYYEVLVDDTETEIRRLIDYCQLPFEESCRSFHENRRAVSTASSEQVRTPIFRSGIDHWRNYEQFLDPLKSALGRLADEYPHAALQR
jgi:tetratricopeptide (TPR) repeat protein